VPVLFIIASLLALAVLPIIVGNHTAQMRDQITRIAEPARRAANRIQVDLSSELDKVIAFQVTGQPQFRDAYRTLLSEQVHDYAVLRNLGPRLGEDVDRDLQVLSPVVTPACHRWVSAMTCRRHDWRVSPAATAGGDFHDPPF